MNTVSEAVHNCVVLLNKYKWMAGDVKSPESKVKAKKDRVITSQKPVTDEERATILKLYHEGLSYKEIIEGSGRSHPVIIRVLKKAGITPRSRYRHLNEQDEAQIEQLWREGVRPSHISRKLGIPESTVYKRIKLFGPNKHLGK